MKYANVNFQRVDHSADVRITFDPNGGSWSKLGTQCLLSQDPLESTMNLGTVTPSSDFTQGEYGTILHEFGHVLGMLHEHQSPARGQRFTFNADGKGY